MKLPFEEWVIQKRLSSNVLKLFGESFICYRNSAYQASLLFSYLAFFTILKEIIIRSVKPIPIQQGRWENIIRYLQNDDTWEKTVYDELINSSAPIFNISDSIRQQVKYWKDRRNDCAHFKSNEIESHHTESFWSFVKSNLNKITIEGGKDSLLNKFEIHFDPTYTPLNSDFSHLTKEIDEAVELLQLATFWKELFDKIGLVGFFFPFETDETKLCTSIFQNCNEFTRESLSQFMKETKDDLIVIAINSHLINYFNYSPGEVREIWRKRIWANKQIVFPIYTALLRNGLIPAEEISEANRYVFDKATDCKPDGEFVHFVLAQNGFGDYIFQVAILNGRLDPWFTLVNPRADMIAYYIEKYPLRNETVEVICEMYTRVNYSFWLAERLVKIFAENPQKKSEFQTVANRLNAIIPSELK